VPRTGDSLINAVIRKIPSTSFNLLSPGPCHLRPSAPQPGVTIKAFLLYRFKIKRSGDYLPPSLIPILAFMLFIEVMVFIAEVQFELCVLLFGERGGFQSSRGGIRGGTWFSGKDRSSSFHTHFFGAGGLDSAPFFSGPDFPFFVADCLALATALFCSNFAFFKPGGVDSEAVPSFVSAGLSYEHRERFRSDATSEPNFISGGCCGIVGIQGEVLEL
jgi:hypothetical protein